jgi:hypothetical protein
MLGLFPLWVGCSSIYDAQSMVSLAPVVPPRGFFYSRFRAPLVFPSPEMIRQMSEAPTNRLIYIKIPTPYVNLEVTKGAIDLESACRLAGIGTLIAADYEYLSVAGYFKSVRIHAYGLPVEAEDAAAAD